MATAPLGPPPQSLRSTALARNTRLPNRIRRRPGEPTDNLTKPDYVRQASHRYPFAPGAEPDSCSLQPAPLFDLLITELPCVAAALFTRSQADRQSVGQLSG